MDSTPYTVKRLMRRELRIAGERGTVTIMGEFPDKADAYALHDKCKAEETDHKYTYEVVRMSRPAGIAAQLR